jgi:hypothetical protein
MHWVKKILHAVLNWTTRTADSPTVYEDGDDHFSNLSPDNTPAGHATDRLAKSSASSSLRRIENAANMARTEH